MGLERDPALAVANRETIAFIDVQEAMARQSVLMGLGAFCYANEYLTIAEFEPLQDAIGRAFPAANLRFFDANREVDGRHTAMTEDVIAALMLSDGDLDEVQKGAAVALDARVAFYDALLESGTMSPHPRG